MDKLLLFKLELISFLFFVQAMAKFVNSNAVTKLAKTSRKSPELLAKYCDNILRKSSKNPEEGELDDSLSDCVSSNNFPLQNCYAFTVICFSVF